jgi:dipeptidyl aminopeptidase/acylaminoacyl peptidase
MPWDGCELWTAPLGSDGRPGPAALVAGGTDESLFQPQWSLIGELYFVSDRTGWWNLYRQRNGKIEPLAEMEAEFGRPQWVFGQSTYAFESAARLVCTYTQNGQWRLATLDTESKALAVIECPYTDISDVKAGPGVVLFRGGSPSEPEAIVRLTLATGATEILRRSATISDDLRRYVSIPETSEFPTEDNQTAYGFYYAPHNPEHAAPDGELPPLIIISHGGPTGATSSTLSLPIQYWTSRGFAVFDVNYGGSTGYGTAYRRRLNGKWGVVDINDCVNGAKFLAGKGLADPERLIIRGGSAGGYTTLAALAFRDVFRAGASYYGVSDLEALALETHKFESRYMDSMVGPYPETRDIYRARSPIHHVDKLSAPVIFLQGNEDKIVLPNQAELMLAALRKKGVPAAYLLFDGEQHGFRRAENIKRALDAELYFYATMLLRKGLRF